MYLHDYKSTYNLLEHSLAEIIQSPQFKVFRQRNANPMEIKGCAGCTMLTTCHGGCAARSFLYHRNKTGQMSMLERDPYCPRDIAPQQAFPQKPTIDASQRLVHMDYLCTWIGTPR